MSREEIENELDALPETAVILPVYKYEHSGIKLNTSGFRSRWDSGQIGYIYADLESDQHSVDDKERLKEILREEIETYSTYLNGEIYGFKLYEKHTCSECDETHTKQVDSCCGFYAPEWEKSMNDYLPEGAQISLSSTGLSMK
jgi:hypothetical protein